MITPNILLNGTQLDDWWGPVGVLLGQLSEHVVDTLTLAIKKATEFRRDAGEAHVSVFLLCQDRSSKRKGAVGVSVIVRISRVQEREYPETRKEREKTEDIEVSVHRQALNSGGDLQVFVAAVVAEVDIGLTITILEREVDGLRSTGVIEPNSIDLGRDEDGVAELLILPVGEEELVGRVVATADHGLLLTTAEARKNAFTLLILIGIEELIPRLTAGMQDSRDGTGNLYIGVVQEVRR